MDNVNSFDSRQRAAFDLVCFPRNVDKTRKRTDEGLSSGDVEHLVFYLSHRPTISHYKARNVSWVGICVTTHSDYVTLTSGGEGFIMSSKHQDTENIPGSKDCEYVSSEIPQNLCILSFSESYYRSLTKWTHFSVVLLSLVFATSALL